MLTAGSMCIDAEMKDMLNAASGNRIDSGRECYGMGDIMGNVKTDLVVAQGNLNAQLCVNFLNNNLLPFMQNFGPGLTFQHDNARPHTSLVTANFLAQNRVNVLPWPALSPDMNPIKHIWDEFGQRARTNHQINNVQDLTQAPQLEWQALPNILIRRHVNSMWRRIPACIASNGGHQATDKLLLGKA